MTLRQFINQDRENRAHVTHPDFSTLYVRHATHMVSGALVPTFDIGTVQAKTPGNGAFTRLLASLSDLGKPIYVESVLTDRFAQWLIKHGFEPSTNDPNSYVRVSPPTTDTQE